MVKFKFLAQLPEDYLPDPVLLSLKLILYTFVAFAYE